MATALWAAGPSAPAAAQQTALFQPPPGCTTYLTVQMRGCLVSNHFRCTADAPGLHRLALADGGGLFAVNLLDAEFQWLGNFFPQIGRSETLVQPATDPASFTTLIRSGRDDYSFEMRGSDGTLESFTGYDALTGSSVVIDGETLQSTEFAYRRTDGTTGDATDISGQQFVSARFGLFFSGVDRTRGPDGTVTTSNLAPRRFSEPGEPGFQAAEPIFDCNTVLSAAPLPQLPITPAAYLPRRADQGESR